MYAIETKDYNDHFTGELKAILWIVTKGNMNCPYNRKMADKVISDTAPKGCKTYLKRELTERGQVSWFQNIR